MPDRRESSKLVVLIAFEKLLRTAALVFVGLQTQRLIHSNDATEQLHRWIHELRIDPGNKHLHNLIHRITGISHRQMEVISFGSFAYAALFFIEGVGLLGHRRWAEYLTVISTAMLLPMEAWELDHPHHRLIKFILLALNVAILAYLVALLRKTARLHRENAAAKA